MRTLLLLILSFQVFLASAQNFNDYQSLESTGAVPSDFLRSSSEKFETSQKANKKKGEKRFTKKSKEKFLLKSSFELNDVLFGGKVLFNDTLSKYINEVADELLKEDKALRNKLRFYILKSSAVNAFTTNDGMIFVTMGLLSQVENEAQLAFILSHEIAHFQKQHVITQYVENQKIIHNRGYGRAAYKDKLIRSNQYSQKLETEADLVGCDLFLKSAYNAEGVTRVFDVLKYSYLPFDDVPFDTTYFQNEHYEFPSSYWMNEIKQIAVDEDYDATKSTHPSTEERKGKVLSKIEGLEIDAKSDYYMNSKTQFTFMQKTARFELCKTLLYEGRYEQAIYHIYLLQRQDPSNYYLDKSMTFALYYLYKEKITTIARSSSYSYDSDDDDDSSEPYSQIEGESQQVYSLTQKMPTKELGVLALRQAVASLSKYQNKPEFKSVVLDIIYMLNKDSGATFTTFKKSYKTPTKPVESNEEESEKIDQKLDIEKLSKIDKIKMSKAKKTEKEEVLADSKYYRYALVEYLDKLPELESIFTNAVNLSKRSQEREEKELTYSQEKKRKRKVRKHGHHFGIDGVIVVNPNYTEINFKKKEVVRYLEGEKSSHKLNEAIVESADRSGLKVELLDEITLQSKSLQQYNDMMFLNNWMIHRSSLLLDQDTSLFVSFDVKKLERIQSDYNSKYCVWTGFTSIHERKTGVGLWFASSFFYGITLPYAIYYAASPEKYLRNYVLMYDTTNGQLVWAKLIKYKNNDNNAVINSIVYDNFRQIKSKKK